MEIILTLTAIIVVTGMFTNFFGLLDLWENRGNWYIVTQDELATIMQNLVKLGAFKDSDAIPNEMVKVKAYQTSDAEVYYRVKVPNRVFKYQEAKLNEAKKAELLGFKWL